MDLLRIYVIWNLAGRWTKLILCCWTYSQTKCKSSSKCFVRKCMMGLALSRTTPRLSEKSWGWEVGRCNSCNRDCNQRTSVRTTTILLYSASVPLRDTTRCLWDDHAVRMYGLKLEGGELFKGGFHKLFKLDWNSLLETRLGIQLAKKQSLKQQSTRKTIGCFEEIIGCLYQ